MKSILTKPSKHQGVIIKVILVMITIMRNIIIKYNNKIVIFKIKKKNLCIKNEYKNISKLNK